MKKYSKEELADWFIGKAKTAAGIRRNILNKQVRAQDSTVIGKMYFFKYDAKWKDKLPLWDMYPLVFPIEGYKDGFLGLNLHYLGSQERLIFIQALLASAGKSMAYGGNRMQLSYDLIKNTRGLIAMGAPCIKRYLYGYARSRFIEILPEEWDRAAQLPIDLFVFKK